MAKIKAMPKPEEHPEGLAFREQGEVAAAKCIDRFVSAHAKELASLIQTYADADADGKLADLREKFWGEVAEAS